MKSLILAAAAALLIPASAFADSLLGQSGSVSYNFPCQTCVYANQGGPYNFTVGYAPTYIYTNGDLGAPGIVKNTITREGIDIHFTGSATWASAAFNGEVFSFPGLNIFGVEVEDNDLGAVITHDANHIYINWQGESFNRDREVELEVEASPVPEPSSFLLFGTGLIGAAGALRRRFNA